MIGVYRLGYEVFGQGLGLLLGFRVSWFRISDFVVSGLWFQGSGSGCRVSGFGFRAASQRRRPSG